MRVGWVSSSRDRKVASYRYRVEAPIAALRDRGHDAAVADPRGLEDFDVLVLSKAYSADHQALARSAKARGAKVVFEISDNHFYNPFNLPKYAKARDQILSMVGVADQVIATTDALAQVLRAETGAAAVVVNDAVERLETPVPRRRAPGEPWRLLWFGSHGSPNAPCGMTDLLLIQDELEHLASRMPIELQVCSNNREKYLKHIAPMRLPTSYRPWLQETFPAVLAQADAVLLPITLNPFTACKTHNRLTTALYAGVPVVATGIDSYLRFAPFCTLDDWSGGIERALNDNDAERARAAASTKLLDSEWTIEAIAPQWERALGLQPPVKRRRRAAGSARSARLRLQGQLDALGGKAVSGWVCSPLDPDMSLSVELLVDGEVVATAPADRPRPDLSRHGLPADCGFSLPLPAGKLAGRRVRVRVVGTEWRVPGEPILRGTVQRRAADRVSPTNPDAETRRGLAASLDHQWRLLEDMQRLNSVAGAGREAMARAWAAADPNGGARPAPSADGGAADGEPGRPGR